MVRRARGALLPPAGPGRPRGRELYRSLRSAVLEGILGPGERLPSSRQAAADFGVSRGLVELVYGQLTVEGFLERGVGRGTSVVPHVRNLPAREGTGPARSARPASRRGRDLAANARCREPEALRPFNAGIADTRHFPWRTWQRLLTRTARQSGALAMRFADPRGLPELRTEIARYLAQSRGMACRPEQVVVFASSQQALLAIALLLLDRGESVWLEDPGYPGARAAFGLAGASVTPVPVDAQGIRVDAGIRRAPGARLAYVTPSHQYPTGVMLSLERRLALLAWAARARAWIVEDDYDGEFRYAGQQLTTLHSLDAGGRVIYVGTLSKAMFVSLRLAYAVLPEALVEPLANLRTQLDAFPSAHPQMAMAAFMAEGHFPTHLRRMRVVYGAKRAELERSLAPLAARGWTWSDNPAGLHLLLRHADGARVRAVRQACPLELATLRAYRARFARDDGLFLRFGGLDLDDVRAGARTLVEAALR